jgi:hypothetical protein
LVASAIKSDERKAIRDHIVSLVCNDDAAIRDLGLRFIDQGESRGVLREAERRHVVEQAVLWLGGRIDSIDTSYRPLLARLAHDVELTNESTRDNLVNVLKGMLSRGSLERSLASEYLAEIQLDPNRREEVVEELVHWAKQETDESARHELIRRAFAIGSQDRRSKAWKVIEGYLRELKEAEEPDRSLAINLLGESDQTES